MNRLISLSLLLFLFTVGNLFGQGESTYDFLNIDMSARAGALGGTFVANNDDPNVIFYNPAGIALLDNSPISFSFVKHLLDINLASLSYSTDLKNFGRIGAAVKYINYGSFNGYDEAGNPTTNYNVGEIAFIAGYANMLDKNLYYGANVKFIYSKIQDYTSTGIALDLGLHYSIPSNLVDIGFSILNAGTQLTTYASTRESLPLDVAIGVSKKMEHIPVKISLDFHDLNQSQSQALAHFKYFTFGAEINLSKAFALRFGYNNQRRQDLQIGSFAGIAGFNAGIGLQISKYRFDYGFSSLGLVGTLHRISISTNI